MAFWNKAHDLQRRAEWLSSQTFVLLAIHVRKDNEKTPNSAEQFFAALHGIFRNDPIVQEHVSFELVASKDSIIFYVFTPLHLRDFIEGQLYAQYPDLDIKQVSDYTKETNLDGMHVAVTRMQLTKEDVYPIKTYVGQDVDTLSGITAVLSGLDAREHVWFQMISRPVGDKWQDKGVSYVQSVRKTGGAPSANQGLPAKAFRLGMRVLQEAISPGSGLTDSKSASAEPPKLSAPQEAALKGVESKITKLGFEVIFRLVVVAPDELAAKARTQATLAAFKQFNTTNLNGFMGGEIHLDNYGLWQQFITREFEEKGNILNIEELASVYHFPSNTVETSAISWSGSKKGEAPFNLPLKDVIDPKNLTILGATNFRNSSQEFGIKSDDRMRHIYVIGKSGTGKSTLLENMIIDDVNAGRGVVVVDPHGELADKVIDAVPESRIKDVVVFDPSDREFPIAFNILDVIHEDQKGNVASGFVGALKKIFGNSWGPRLEYILRNATLAILDTEHPTMLGIPQMLTDASFRNRVIPMIKDPVVLDFWKNEWAAKDQKQQVEEMGSILNKVGQFLSTSLIRNIVGQPKSGFDMRQIMDDKKILIVNLSKGKIGEDNSALLGTMMITKVQLAAMSRADVAPSERPECFLYVDEFQNFATESFATILSEARKYNLGLTIAHQYIAQMTPEVKDAVFGNVGSMISFRVGSEDATALKPEFTPVFDENDLVNLQRGNIYIKLLIDGLAMPAFSAQTMPPRPLIETHRSEVINYSRLKYAIPRAEAETLIDETAGYKKKRDAESAAKQAGDILKQGNERIGIKTPGTAAGTGHASSSAPAQASAPVVAVPAPVTNLKPVTSEPAPSVQPVSATPVFKVVAPAPRAVEPTEVALPISAPVSTEVLPAPVAEEMSDPNLPMIMPEIEVPMLAPDPAGVLAIVSEEPGHEIASLHDFAPEAHLHLEEEGIPKLPRKEKPLKVLDGWAYKEVAQKGGLKWYLGELEKDILARQEEKRLLKEQMRDLEQSPIPVSPTEQIANADEIRDVSVGDGDSFVLPATIDVVPRNEERVTATSAVSMSISEGQNIYLP
jgi:hypothetical protein